MGKSQRQQEPRKLGSRAKKKTKAGSTVILVGLPAKVRKTLQPTVAVEPSGWYSVYACCE